MIGGKDRGESISEALVALLISVMAGLLLAGAMVFIQNSAEKSAEYQKQQSMEIQQIGSFLKDGGSRGQRNLITAEGEEGIKDEAYIRIYTGEKTGLFAFILE